MNSPAADSPPTAPVPRGKRKRERRPPLWHRIIYDDAMVAIVRLLGHDGLPHRDVPAKSKPLIEKFGRERLQEAADEITEIVGDGNEAVARLSDEAAKFAIQLLGRPRTAGSNGKDDYPPLPQTPAHVESVPDLLRTQGNSVTTQSEPETAPMIDASSAVVREQGPPIESPSTPTNRDVEPDAHEWANYETACVAAFLNGDREFLNECLHLVELCREQVACRETSVTGRVATSEVQTSLLADQLQRLVCEYNPLAEDDTIFANLLDAALSNVDWHDLADSFLKQSAAKVVED